MTAVRYSVIVPTRDRNDHLSRCLARLAPGMQDMPADRYEVIVTDDSAGDAARALVAEHFPWARWTAGPRRGPAANRNSAAASSTAEFLVFLDDDCLPEGSLLASYERAERTDVHVYEGRITCNEGFSSPRQTAPLNLDGGALWSCNFAIRRSAYSAVRGFDERFPLAHMEDVDLRERLRAAGFVIQFVAAAGVDHPPRRLPWGTKLARLHQAGVLYMVLHPPVRGLPWYLQNTLRARVSRIRQLPKSLDSLIDLASLPLELSATVWHWRSWMSWARSLAPRDRT